MNKTFFILFLLLSVLGCTHQKEPLNFQKPVSQQPIQKSETKNKNRYPDPFIADNPERIPSFHPGKKKRTAESGHTEPADTSLNPGKRIQDKLDYLKNRNAEIDFNEPSGKRFFSSPLEPSAFPGMIFLSRDRFLKVSVDNDIIDYTDRFYTNGIRIDLISPVFAGNPVVKILVPYWGSGTNYYGLSIVQNLYTPSTTKTGGILFGDRPYAAYLFLGCFKITNDPIKRFRLSSELDLGIIGPYSFGEWVQESFHNVAPGNNEPLGWEYQIRNDLVLNYGVTFEKGLLEGKWANLNVYSSASLGTLYTNISGGFHFRAGFMNPYFANLGITRTGRLKLDHLRRVQCYIFVKGSGKLVGYDATLEGGLINHDNVYTLPASSVSRIVFQTTAGLTLTYGGFQIEAEQFLLSPEFTEGMWHKWVHIGLTFCF